MLIAAYLAAIVAANLTVATWGPGVTIINAFLLIGLDLTARDALHERWQHRHLTAKMGALIGAGAALSWALNRDAGRIALASTVAFAAAAAADAGVYALLRRRSRTTRMNGSNAVSAGVDSILFPTLAFGAFLPLITLGQYAAKVFGGALWAWVLNRQQPTRCAYCGKAGEFVTMIDAETLDRTRLHSRCVGAFEEATAG